MHGAESVDKVDTLQMRPALLGSHLRYSRSIASAKASLVGARAALRDRLRVFLTRQSPAKNDLNSICLQSIAPR